MQVTTVGGARQEAEVAIENFGLAPVTIPPSTILGLVGEECELTPVDSNRLIRTFTNHLKKREGIDVRQYQTEDCLLNEEMVYFIRCTL